MGDPPLAGMSLDRFRYNLKKYATGQLACLFLGFVLF